MTDDVSAPPIPSAPAVPPAPDAAPNPTPASPPLAPPAPARPATARSGRWLWALAAVAGAVGAVSLSVAWNTQQRVRVLEQELVRRQQTSQDQATEARVLARQALDGVREVDGRLGALDQRVTESQLQRSQVEDLIQSLSRSRDENVLADVEAALRVAMQQASLTGSADPIANALRQADDRLARYNNPRLERVRRAVARDLDRVRSTAAVDVPSLAIRLDEAVRLVDELPLLSTPDRASAARRPPAAARPGAGRRAAVAASAASPASGADEAPWTAALRHAWDTFSTPFFAELRQTVRVTSIDHPEAMLISPQQSFFLRENVKLRLLNARLSLLSRQFDLAQADLQQAQTALNRYFDRGSRRVVVLSDLLRNVSAEARQVSFPRPDDTLAAIAAAEAGH